MIRKKKCSKKRRRTVKGRGVRKANASKKIEPNEVYEPLDYRDLNRIPNIHMLKKPSWATGEENPPEENLDGIEGKNLTQWLWSVIFSIPIIILLSLPLLAVLSLTLFKYGLFPESVGPMTAHMFQVSEIVELDSNYMAGFWALSLIVFVPWSAVVCRLENIACRFAR
ncbi:MAG: hypothetical protein ABIH76_02185 [Candidatus Bathyarchaeota archaeon]